MLKEIDFFFIKIFFGQLVNQNNCKIYENNIIKYSVYSFIFHTLQP